MTRSGVWAAAIPVGIVAGVGAVVWVDEAAGLPEFLYLSVALLAFAGVLRLAVRSARRAAQERTRAVRLASTQEEEVARTAVAVERAGLAADVQAVIRSAATAMGRAADDAADRWDDDPEPALRAVQEQGERAGLELRRLLGLLREADGAAAEPAPPMAPQPRIARGDVVLAVAATVLAVAETFAYRGEWPPGTIGPLSVLLSGGAAATVVIRRAAPELGAVLCGLLFLPGIWTEPLSGGFWLLLTPGSLTWAAVGRGPRGLLAVGVLAAGIGAEMGIRDPENVFTAMLTLSAAAVGGTLVRIADASGGAARARADQRAAELEAAAAAAVRTERLAVARELHDLVSHAVGVMVMQAGAALATRTGDPERARRALHVVRRTAVDTLEELGRLVELLDHGVLGAAVAPPDGHDLASLLGRLRTAGVVVRSDVDGELAGEEGTVVYRVVQESLTNVLRHAPGAGAVVRVHSDASWVAVEVVDDGPGPGSSSQRGYGLVGIEERVRRLGGDFTAGAGPGGQGFRVCARVPAVVRRPA